MDIATDKIANNLRFLAMRIKEGCYGSDIDFADGSFLEDLEEIIVKPLEAEIIKD